MVIEADNPRDKALWAYNTITEELIQKHIKARLDNIEHFVARFLDETKLKPSECELVEQRKEAGETVWFCRKREI